MPRKKGGGNARAARQTQAKTNRQRNERRQRSLEQAAKLNEEYQRTSDKAEGLRAKRNAAIYAAVNKGVTQADVARALNLTPGRVKQILNDA